MISIKYALLTALIWLLQQISLTASADSSSDRIWVGPMPFVEGRDLRPDWTGNLLDESNWASILKQADVFKSYLMVLPEDHCAGKTTPELTDEQMLQLINLLRKHEIKVAFEVGGLRNSTEIGGEQAGEKYAEFELRHLRRWKKLGGQIDYITTDHAVMMNIRGCGFPGPGVDPNRAWKMTVQELSNELADYFAVLHKEIPEAKFGVIESLGFFHIHDIAGYEYSRTDPYLPVMWFEQYFDDLLAAMRERDLVLDHFHIDYGWEGVQYDGHLKKTLDFGRVLGVERFVQSRGVKSGVIFNAFHDTAIADPDPVVASHEACERTLEFTRGYLAAKGNSNHIVIQSWQPYPDKTGCETEPETNLGLIRNVMALVTPEK